LLLEDNPGDARLIQEMLTNITTGTRFSLTWVQRVAEAIQQLAEQTFDVILLDLGLPDGNGTDVFARVSGRAPSAPVVVLTGTFDDQTLALELIQKGAQDYLVKGQVDTPGLVRTLCYAIERKRAQQDLETKNQELKNLNHIMMGREERILELKREVQRLRAQLGLTEEESQQPPG
jgi:DNA-binding NtrC family response regulator